MGRLIEQWELHGKKAELWIVNGKLQIRNRGTIHNIELSKMGVIPKADYENRLKADLVAMLTEIQLEIDELKNEPACCQHYKRGVNRSSDVIQQKIDKLKEDKNGENNN